MAIIPLGYLLIQGLKKKDKKTKEEDKGKNRCFDIKKLLDEKLKELTDLRGRVESEIKDKAREKVMEITEGTKTGDALVMLEKAEKEFERLKKLYEECMIDFNKNIFKAIIIENGLSDKKILDELNIEKTYTIKDKTIHNVELSKDLISKLQKSIADGPWFIKLWNSGGDDMTVIFKDKTFSVKISDRSSWNDAINFGKSIGVSEDELDFSVV